MTRRLLVLCFAVFALWALGAAPRGQTPPPAATALVERVGDTAFIQIEAESFKQLDATPSCPTLSGGGTCEPYGTRTRLCGGGTS